MLLRIICLLLISASAVFAVPQLINYQGSLADESGTPLDTTVNITFTIYDAPTGGSNLWAETQSSVAVENGFFAVQLGSVTALNDLFTANRWLGIAVGSDSEMLPRQQIVSVAHSYRVGTVDGASGGTISGKLNVGDSNTNTGAFSFVTGQLNSAAGGNSIVTGGVQNTANGDLATVGGGINNHADAGWSTVSGGTNNHATADFAVVSGGGFNSNAAFDGTISGGYGNIITATTDATIGGGYENTASDQFTTIGGGMSNTASQIYATIGGGTSHVASGVGSTIGGGNDNDALGSYTTVAGGNNNAALFQYGAIGGGQNNQAGQWGTVPGGFNNYAGGNYSFAAGRDVNSTSVGAFVWGSSSTGSPTSPEANYTVTFRCENGARFYTHASNNTTGVNLPAGGGAWANLCDVNEKKLLGGVNTSEVLTKVSSLPLHRWSYKSQDESIQHIGPTAQDFYAAFGLGDNNTTISTLDPDGVLFAAVQELAKQVRELSDENQRQQTQIQALLADKQQSAHIERKEK